MSANLISGRNNKIKKFISMVLVFTMTITLFPNTIYADSSNLISASRTATTSTVKTGDNISVTYTITPQPIPVTTNTNPKDIVLVMDTSQSMNSTPDGKNVSSSDPAKLDTIKTVATNFVNSFKNNSNVNIGLIEFRGIGKVDTTNNVNKLDNLATNSSDILAKISNLNVNDVNVSGTNIGDGLRQAYILNNNNNNGHDKYIVFMTDGQADTYSYSGNNSSPYLMSLATSGYSTKSDSSNYTGVKYAENIGQQLIAKSNIKSYYIGFGSDASGSTNSLIASYSNSVFYNATNTTTITDVYNNIQQEIEKSILGTATLNESFNANLSVDTSSLPSGFSVSGNTITGDINVTYTLSANKSQYTAQPVTFTITYKANSCGTGTIGTGGNSSSIIYTVNNQTQTVNLQELPITINEANQGTAPTVNANTSWTNQSVPVTITLGSASELGVKTTEYQITDSSGKVTTPWTSFNPFSVTNEGYTTITARTTDNQGVVLTSNPVTVKIDKTPPPQPTLVNETADGDIATNQTYVDITFPTDVSSAQDKTCSGVKTTEYSTDNINWILVTTDVNNSARVKITQNGTVYARSTDLAGNISAVNSIDVKNIFTPPDSATSTYGMDDLPYHVIPVGDTVNYSVGMYLEANGTKNYLPSLVATAALITDANNSGVLVEFTNADGTASGTNTITVNNNNNSNGTLYIKAKDGSLEGTAALKLSFIVDGNLIEKDVTVSVKNTKLH